MPEDKGNEEKIYLERGRERERKEWRECIIRRIEMIFVCLYNSEKLAGEVALLKRNCFASVFEKYFDTQAKGGDSSTAIIHYRDQETMLVCWCDVMNVLYHCVYCQPIFTMTVDVCCGAYVPIINISCCF